MRKNLTIKQHKFVKEIVRTGNGTQAAMKIYNAANERSAEAIGSENLSKPIIQAAIQRELTIMECTPDRVVAGISKEALTADESHVRLKGWELLGKTKFVKLFVEQHEHTVTDERKPRTLEELRAEFDRLQTLFGQEESVLPVQRPTGVRSIESTTP